MNSFEIVNDVLFIETENNFIITKISFTDGEFIDPKAPSYIIKHNENPFQKISKRYKKDNKVYYAVLNVEEYPPISNNFKIYPTIYEFDTLKYNQKSHIPDISTDSYIIYGDDITYIKAESPTFTYNNKNDMYYISFLLKDASNFFVLNEFVLELGPFKMIEYNQYKQK